MDRQKITEILNRIITLRGDIYDISHTEEDISIKREMSLSIDTLEETEGHLKKALRMDTDRNSNNL